MILAIILRDRSGSSCLNGRRRTRDWSGRRIVDVRWTRIEEVLIMDWLIRKTDPEAAIVFNVGSSNPARRDVSTSLLFLRSTSRAQPGKRVWPRQPLWM